MEMIAKWHDGLNVRRQRHIRSGSCGGHGCGDLGGGSRGGSRCGGMEVAVVMHDRFCMALFGFHVLKKSLKE